MGYLTDAMRNVDPGEPGDDRRLRLRAPANETETPAHSPAAHDSDAHPQGDTIGFNPDAPSSNFDDNIDDVDSSNTDHDAVPAPTGVDDRLVAWLRPASIMAEEYRSIRTGLLARWQQRTNLIHTITSATPQEGKTITSLNLGFSFSELERRKTVVIESDLRLPQFRKLLNLPESRGMVDLLRGDATLDEVTLTVGDRGLHVIPAGERVSNEAVQLLSSKPMKDLLKTLRKRYDHVIIDTPPVVELADAGILGALSDDVLLIVRMNQTPRPLVEQAIRTLESYNAPVVGMIATDQPRRNRRYYYRYGYRYGYRYYANRYAEAA